MDCSVPASIEESLVMDFELARTSRVLAVGASWCWAQTAVMAGGAHRRVESPCSRPQKRPHAAPRATEAIGRLEVWRSHGASLEGRAAPVQDLEIRETHLAASTGGRWR
jgi:hypothetical protein